MVKIENKNVCNQTQIKTLMLYILLCKVIISNEEMISFLVENYILIFGIVMTILLAYLYKNGL